MTAVDSEHIKTELKCNLHFCYKLSHDILFFKYNGNSVNAVMYTIEVLSKFFYLFQISQKFFDDTKFMI